MNGLEQRIGALICSAAAMSCGSDRTGDEVRVVPPVHCVEISKRSPMVEVEFQVVNDGAADFEIVSVRKGCGCVNVKLDQYVVRSGATSLARCRVRGASPGRKLVPVRFQAADGRVLVCEIDLLVLLPFFAKPDTIPMTRVRPGSRVRLVDAYWTGDRPELDLAGEQDDGFEVQWCGINEQKRWGKTEYHADSVEVTIPSSMRGLTRGEIVLSRGHETPVRIGFLLSAGSEP